MLKIFKIHINEAVFKALLILAFAALVLAAFLSRAFFIRTSWSRMLALPEFLILPFSLAGILALVNIVYRTVLFLRYKSLPLNGHTPAISIVIPAYNEGAMIRHAIDSALAAEYPAGRKEVFCVNDGSTDDTLHHIREAKKEHGRRLQVISYAQNRGKREAMAAAIRRAKGEIIVTMDSDTIVDPAAFLHLVAPFVDKRIGAVTGHVQAHNFKENLLTRMVGVRYAMAFDFYRATQSSIRTVFCCSGVISAYRKKILDKVMAEWLHQVFLGKVCTIGDDRSLTNHFIREGYDTVYARKAVARTVVPNRVAKLFKMILRWNKSFFRETIFFFRYAFRPYRKKNRVMPLLDCLLALSMIVMQAQLYVILVYYASVNPLYLLKFLSMVAIMGGLYMLFYVWLVRSSDFVYGILYAFLFVFVIFWTFPLAALSFSHNTWLTR